jgi:outer membrane lipoprotein SlyB
MLVPRGDLEPAPLWQKILAAALMGFLCSLIGWAEGNRAKMAAGAITGAVCGWQVEAIRRKRPRR